MGAWGAVAGALIAVWAVAAVVGGGTWFPWWLLVVIPWIWVLSGAPGAAGNSHRPPRCLTIRTVRVVAAWSSTLVSGPSAGFLVVSTRGLA